MKCTFGIMPRKFLVMVNHQGIEMNLDKIRALIEMCPIKPKEVKILTSRVAELSIFVSQAIDECSPSFQTLKGEKRI